MGSFNHKRERGHSPVVAARKSQHGYSGIAKKTGFGQKSRSQSPARDEPILRGQAARKGKSSAIAVALAGIAYTMERRSLNLKLEVLGAKHPDTIESMYDVLGSPRSFSGSRTTRNDNHELQEGHIRTTSLGDTVG